MKINFQSIIDLVKNQSITQLISFAVIFGLADCACVFYNELIDKYISSYVRIIFILIFTFITLLSIAFLPDKIKNVILTKREKKRKIIAERLEMIKREEQVERELQEDRKDNMSRISADCIRFLHYHFIDKNENNPVELWIESEQVKPLEKIDVIERRSAPYYSNTDGTKILLCSYAMSDWAWKYVQENPTWDYREQEIINRYAF